MSEPLTPARGHQGDSRRPIKLNLYRDYEVEAVAQAMAGSPVLQMGIRLDCLMVSDSYLMTHLGRDSTRLARGEQALFLEVMAGLVREVSHRARQLFPSEAPYIVGDMPDGSVTNGDIALRSADRMRRAGADVVKLEVHSEAVLAVIERLAREGFRVMAHLGYTPQGGGGGRVGGSLDGARALFASARQVRDAGAESLVLEKLDEFVHRALVDRPEALPSYAIFSGKSETGGQSLNIWDSVFKPGFRARYFPPTAQETVDAFPMAYSVEAIAAHIGTLLGLTAAGEFPLSPPTLLSIEDVVALASCDPWAA
ncbi:3-methyl-2-oxobutanoate hydroxymethyltransferase [Sphingobium sp. Cam5-1]|uniref:3-methyl-2-oxobutanoate hydroxymethyltransferase n=1 Tax=Sphingobium sp. Cam5-1 TaxID=2789327 RepID=UPI0018AD10C4|nr:3-methyl-2-oxobutanoate hydroxymethyltransferase [Sphingobium sp. Cam5-1]QPI71964.1 3-methyl-2-oxobutanoate hydroxymethyltransferase [Sphingobium sp. Cam5-1]